MKLPAIPDPSDYFGLYVVDFGDAINVGYRLEEVRALLEREEFSDAKVFRIHGAHPDGRLELQGVPRVRFEQESGMFFRRAELESARTDFESLRRLATEQPPVTRAFLHLFEAHPETVGGEFGVALIYPAEADPDFANWLLENNFDGGEFVEGGVSHVTDYYALDQRVLDRDQLFPAAAQIRSYDQLLKTRKVALQR